MKIFGYTLPQIKKTVYTALGFTVAVLTYATQNSLVPEEYVSFALGALGVVTTVIVFLAKNAPLEPDPLADVKPEVV